MRLNSRIDKTLTYLALALILVICIPIAIFPETGEEVLSNVYDAISGNFGWLYLAGGAMSIVFLLWISFSKYGAIRLGTNKPEFSTFSWAAMIFASGIGTGVLYWGVIEWALHYESPPFGVTPFSPLAAEYAAAYGIFHWGFTGWAFFAVTTLPVAYAYYIRKQPIYRISEACRGVLGNLVDGVVGRVIDVAFIIGLLGAGGTSLGLGTPLIAAAASEVLGIPQGFALNLAVILLTTLIFSVSVYTGISKGIKWLSDISIFAAIILLGFVLIVGPTQFIMNMSVSSLSLMLQEFVRMSLWTSPLEPEGSIPLVWTVFYWGWWLVLAPFMGIFVARISAGRTIRQVVLGMVGYGSLGCALFYMILGNYALDLELTGVLKTTEMIKEVGTAQAVVEVIKTLPGGNFTIAIYGLITLVFLATLFDSGSYSLASVTLVNFKEGEEPSRAHRLFWACAIAILPITLLFIGGLKALQTASLVGAFPLIFILFIMAISFSRDVMQDDPDRAYIYENKRLAREKR